MKNWLISILLFLTCIISTASCSAEYFTDIIITSPNGIWTDSRAYSTLQDAIDAVGASEQEIIVAKEEICTTLTVPSNVHLKFTEDGSITNSGLLTINGSFKAGLNQIFTGTGNVRLGDGVIKEAYPQWTGAKGDGVTDDSAAFDTLFQIISNSGGGDIFIPPGDYRVEEVKLRSNLHISGAGYATRLFATDIPAKNVFYNTGLNVQYFSSRTYYNLSNITAGSDTLTFTTPGENANFAVGDLCFVRTTGSYIFGAWEFPYHIEIIKIVEVGAGYVKVDIPIQYDMISPQIANQETVGVGLNDCFYENTVVENLYLDAGLTGGAGIRSQGAYKCQYRNLWIRARETIIGNAYNHCIWENIIGIDFSTRVIELKAGSLNTTVRNVKAYADLNAASFPYGLIESGEYACGLKYQNIEIYASHVDLAGDKIIGVNTAPGEDITIENIKAKFKTVNAVIVIYAPREYNGKNIIFRDINVDVGSADIGVKIDTTPFDAGIAIDGLKIENIRIVGAVTYGLDIIGTGGGVKNVVIDNMDIPGRSYILPSATIENLTINGSSISTFADADATPAVTGNFMRGNVFETFTNILTITDFDDGYKGQVITVISKAAITFDTTTAQDANHNLDGSSANIVTAVGDITRWVCEDGTTWRLVAFVDASADNSGGA